MGGHAVCGPSGEQTNAPAGISIGNHVWIAYGVDVFKGSRIPDGCVVAGRALLTGKFEESNTLIGGLPAKVIRRNISWEL